MHGINDCSSVKYHHALRQDSCYGEGRGKKTWSEFSYNLTL